MSTIVKNRIKCTILLASLLVGMINPSFHVYAEEDISQKLPDKCGLEPIKVIEIPEGEIFDITKVVYSGDDMEITSQEREYWTKFSSYHFCESMTEQERAFWKRLEEAALTMAATSMDYTSGALMVECDQSIARERMIDLMFMFLYSHPQYYFLSNSVSCDSGRGGLCMYEAFCDGAVRESYTEQFTDRIDQWVAEIETAGRPEEKIKYAHDIICNNTIYDYSIDPVTEERYDQSAYSMVLQGTTVCAGYTKAMSILGNALGIDTVAVTSSSHAWNYVKLHGVWYELDVTWDDGDPGIDYWCYLKSCESIGGNETSGSHVEDDYYINIRPDAPYDMLVDWDYVSPYFEVDGNTYVVQNSNAELAELLAKPIAGMNAIPETASYNGMVYRILGGTSGPAYGEADSNAPEQVNSFVERMYTVALARSAEQDGLEYWANKLLSGENDGAGIAYGFLQSPEFINKKLADADYVKVLYATFFDRVPAAEEISYWAGELSSGKSREYVLAGFVNSNEFDSLCDSYGISRGFLRQDGNAINAGIGRFAERLYTRVLERAGEKEGIEYWSVQIADGACTPENAAKSFFASPEYLNKQTDNGQYINALYRTFMGREAEANGMAYWLEVLDNGAGRETILSGFAQSGEFKEIMKEYGL